MNKLTIGEKDFLLDGKPFRIIAGAMHYFRVPRAYWKDRLLKIKACGFNTVETYTAWNLHEKEEGVYDFSGNLDLGAYLDLIHELGMFAIVRPGPYICSEWEFGGFPWWLLKYDDMELRCMNETYLGKVDRYFEHLIPIIAARQSNLGGAVLMVQVENEYGSYGNDTVYIRYLADKMENLGISVPFFTSDGGCDWMLSGGTAPEIFKTVNFGSDAKNNFKALRRFQKTGPLMCAEYWNGWFDHWGEKHHRRAPEDAVKGLNEILSLGGSVSVYMMHGGTNFGFMNGANCTEDEYQPTVNSYDDDAPIDESGRLTPKYEAFKALLASYGFVNEVKLPEAIPTARYGEVNLTEVAYFDECFACLGTPVPVTNPLPMEKLNQGYGFIYYTTVIKGPKEKQSLKLAVHDRAWIFINDELKGVEYRNDKKPQVSFSVPDGGVKLGILVENMGRTNYGARLADRKGLTAPVRFGEQILYHWQAYPLPMDDLSCLPFAHEKKIKFDDRPQFLRGTFTVTGTPADTFVRTDGFKKGVIWVNGRVLSRYWHKGPQQTAYLPATWLKEGENEIILFETQGYKSPVITLESESSLG